MGPGYYLLLYRDLGAQRWPKSGELWQHSRKENHMLTGFSSRLTQLWVAKRRQRLKFCPASCDSRRLRKYAGIRLGTDCNLLINKRK